MVHLQDLSQSQVWSLKHESPKNLGSPIVGYRLNCLDEPVFMAVSKPLLTEVGIDHRLESCVADWYIQGLNQDG